MSNDNLSPENNHPANTERFESDTQKIVRRHLENKNDTITEDDIRNVRIGMTPPPDELTENATEQLLDKNDDLKEQSDNPVTPWDTINE
ncbi:MAG: hypothetical protein M3Y85_08160 [Bacteroidota bacterium]|nr:hypothetical protein [Bacteroidota bacterium]